MKSGGLPCVVFLIAADAKDQAPIVEALAAGGDWEPIVVRSPLSGGKDVCEGRTVAALVVIGSVPAAELDVCRGPGASVPVIAIGGAPPAQWTPTCWLSAPPAAGVLRSLILAVDTPQFPRAGPAWRRKSDMIIGSSDAVAELLRMLARLARSGAPVLVTGESGSGKDLVARALHYGGPRAAEPFIGINCAAIPEALFESELFGHERGAFTGAVTARPGAFEAANGGTLFLDEIAEMPLGMQAKLLRVLDRGEIMRLGSSRGLKTTARVVAATNRDLEAEVSAGRFREDLYYRVYVYPVHVPPLRERPEDIPSICGHHLSIIAKREKRRVPRLTGAALEKLLRYCWPGNVRELISTLERAFLLADQDIIGVGELTLPESGNLPPAITPYREAKVRFEHEYYTHLMRAARGNISLAAKLSRKTRKEVYDALKRLHVDVVEYRTDDVVDA